MCSIFFDLAKAFDSVNHLRLVNQLPKYGIVGKTKLLLESYLGNRFQNVQLDSTSLNTKTYSAWTKVKHGVPQGSVLGPFIFLLYINPYPTAFPYGNGMVLHFYQQQESSTKKTVHKVINKGLKTYV